jgi:stringent starvation protein B
MGKVLEFRPRTPPKGDPRIIAKDLPPSEKRDAIVRIMEHGVAMVHLDARKPGAVVPSEYADDAHLRLNLCWGYKTPITFGADGVTAVLSFGGRPFCCELPYSAIFAVSSEKFPAMGEVYLKDLPAELLAHSTVKPA